MNKKEVKEALNKRLPDLTDSELKGILEVPEEYWPTNPHAHVSKDLVEEQLRRKDASKVQYKDVLMDVLHISLLRHLVSYGPRVFPELDQLGIDEAGDEIRKLETPIRAKIQRYKTGT